MKLASLLRNPLYLREEASETPSDGGGAPAPVQTAPETPAAPPAQAAPPVSPTLGDRLVAVALPKADLVAQNRDLNARVGALTGQLSTATGEVTQLRAQIEQLTQENTSFKTALADLEARAKTVDQGVTQELASLKVPRSELVTPTPPAVDPAKPTGDAMRKLTPAQKINMGLSRAWTKPETIESN